MLRRKSNLSCYFCNSPVAPKDPANFRCPHCNCLNRWVDGNIVSDEAAMYDQHLNARAGRAQSKNRLPTMFGRPDIFCHTCQTNQMLIVNLLANYLPPSDGPESDQRLQALDDYRESLYLRYPPVCASCSPAVEEEIRSKDAMARTQALGGWLNQTKGKVKQRQVSLTPQETEKLGREMLVWRVRGCLWAATIFISFLGSASAAFGYRLLSHLSFLLPALPILALVSIFWVAWDPTYSSFRSARIQGRDVRVRGKDKHIALQLLSWGSRMVTSLLLAAYHYRKIDPLRLSQFPSSRSRSYFSVCCAIELCASCLSFFILRLQQPPTIRLIDTTTHTADFTRSRSQTPIPSAQASTSALEPELFASLSFSSRPVVTPPRKPVFGQPSMLSSLITPGERSPDEDEMDMDTPTESNGKAKQSAEPLWLRPQRFFAPEAPTGLEGLLERTTIVDDVTMTDATSVPSRAVSSRPWRWWWLCAFSLVPLAGFAYRAWGSGWRAPQDYSPPPAPPSVSPSVLPSVLLSSSPTSNDFLQSHVDVLEQ